MRVCWNWQTGTFEGRVLHDVRVQVPSLAPIKRLYRFDTVFFRNSMLYYTELQLHNHDELLCTNFAGCFYECFWIHKVWVFTDISLLILLYICNMYFLLCLSYGYNQHLSKSR